MALDVLADLYSFDIYEDRALDFENWFTAMSCYYCIENEVSVAHHLIFEKVTKYTYIC